MVKREQEKAEEERLKDMEERQRKKLIKERIKHFLEAAFDGEKDALLVLLKEVSEQSDIRREKEKLQSPLSLSQCVNGAFQREVSQIKHYQQDMESEW